jgi:hypothetical protein
MQQQRPNPQKAKPAKTSTRNPQNAKPAASSVRTSHPQRAPARAAAAQPGKSRAPTQRPPTSGAKASGNQGGFDVKILPVPPQPNARKAAPGNEGGFNVRVVDPKTRSKGQNQSGGATHSSKPVPIVKSNDRSRPPPKTARGSVFMDNAASWFGLSDPAGAMQPDRRLQPSKADSGIGEKPAKLPARIVHNADEALREYRKFVLKEKEAKRATKGASWDRRMSLTTACEASSNTIKKVSHESMVRSALPLQVAPALARPAACL